MATSRFGSRFFLLVSLCSLLLSSCALSFEPKDSQSAEITPEYPEKIGKTDLVEVEFWVFPTTKFSDQDLLSFDVLDLMSGFDYNIERYTISPDQNNNYNFSVFLPEGATVSYRYSMLQPMQVNELLPDGSEVPFRQVVVRKNLVITDTIAGWTNNYYTGELASLNGAVADVRTEEPLPDVLISVAGKTTMTDMNGRFYLRDLPIGKHNMVASTIDGSHQSFQQEVNLVERLSTLAIVRMVPNPEISITFTLTAPRDIVSAPVRIAGNLRQFGQTLSDQVSGSGVQAVNMPLMNQNNDGTYSVQVKAYAGSFLRYAYTLGNAVINVERDENGTRNIRQFIVPNKDVVVQDTVIGWRSASASPTTFYVQPPDDTLPEDKLYMQFNHGYWSTPVPMWPAQNGKWMLTFFPVSSEPVEIAYRYCRFSDCNIGAEGSTTRSMFIGAHNEIHDVVSSWKMNGADYLSPSGYNPVSLRAQTLVGVELDPAYSSQYVDSYENVVSELAENGFNWLILRQAWIVTELDGLPHIDLDPISTIPSREIERIATATRQAGFTVALYPQLDFEGLEANWWRNTSKNSLWWQQWYSEYERVVTHLIKLGTDIQAEQLILGGPDAWESYPGVIETVAENYGTPKSSEDIWKDLLEKADQYFEGKVLLAHSINDAGSQTYSFYSQVDGLYLLIDSDSESIANASQYLDSLVYLLYEENKLLYIGLNAPSYQTASIEPGSINDPLISATDTRYNNANVNLQVQTQWYASFLDAIANREWIEGVSSRGFFPWIKLSDFSSSIYGKPAQKLFHNQ